MLLDRVGDMFQSPGEIAFSIFGFPVYFYGITLAFSILVGVYTAYFLYKKFYSAENAECIIDFSPYIIILGIIGARLYYCLVNFSYYFASPTEIFNVRQGGLSIHGMIAIGIISLWAFAKLYKMSFLKLLDVFLCAAPLAQSIGRWGNFFNSEAFGMPTNLPWKLFIPIAKRPFEYINFEYFHPTFLYESILDLAIFIILLILFKKLSKNPGVIACMYLILYSIVRIIVEQIRIDSALNISGIPVAQIASIVLIFTSIISLGVIFNKEKSN